MATDDGSLRHRAAELLLAFVLLAGVLWAWVDADLARATGVAAFFGDGSVVRLVGFTTLLVVVVAWYVRRRNAGGDESTDREVEGSGEEYIRYVYNSGADAAKESDRLKTEAERLAEADREANRRR
ncbi:MULTISPECIES: hypothetical protein [Halorussus]|uniref:hypothetical protein n=1 Tax=Halorussus TaxID=1070314 RepID=UPI00209D2365|nr:hypothetical protein [Halorussus vallis]USZ76856.1 hypothetical protein NGM07_05885 [Halorussus vallis]